MKLLLLSAVTFFILCMQPLRAADTLRFSHYHYTDEHGLPQNSVKAIAKDTYGYIWLTTEDGLVRFDGEHFVRIGKADITLSSNRFVYFFRGPDPRAIYAFNDLNEVVRIKEGRAYTDTQTLTPHKQWEAQHTPFDASLSVNYSTGLPNKADYFVIPDHVIISTGQQQYYDCSPSEVLRYRGSSLQQRMPFNGKDLWNFFAIGNDLFYFDRQQKSFFTFNRQGSVVACQLTGDMLKDPAFTDARQPIRLFWNLFSPDFLLCYVNGSFYLLKEKGQGQLESKFILSGVKLENRINYTAFYDEREQRLFLGNDTKGLYVYTMQPFITLTAGHDDDVYYGQMAYDESTILTAQGNLLGLSGSARTVTALKQHVRTDFYSILGDTQGFIWAKQETLLYRLRRSDEKVEKTWQLPDRIKVLYWGQDSTLWIGTEVDGLYRLPWNQWDREPEKVVGNITGLSYILQLSPDFLWLGSAKGLMRYYLKDRRLEPIRELDGQYIRSLYAENNRLWITTYERGFFLYEQNKLTNFPLDRGNFLTASHCILEDKKGYFWITTNKGLFQIAKADLLRYAAGKQEDVFYFYYDKKSGFLTNEFNGGCEPCGVQLGNGFFSLPSLNGLVLFNPEKMQPLLPDGNILADHILLDQRKLQDSQHIRLPRDFGRLTFQFSTSYYGNRRNVQMFYALVHNNEQPRWLPLADDGLLSFSTLPSGKYALHIRKLNGFGPNNYTERVIYMHVDAAWFQQTWFYIVCIAVVGGLFWLFMWLRLRFIKRHNRFLEEGIQRKTSELTHRNDIQEKIIRSVSHDIRTPLQYQWLLAKKMYENMEKDGNVLFIQQARTLSDNSSRMYHMVDNLLRYLKSQVSGRIQSGERISLHDLVDDKIQVFQEIAQGRGIQLINQLPADSDFAGDAQLLAVILHNIIDNAVKFSRKGTITISAISENKRKGLCICDTGPGLDPEYEHWLNNPHSAAVPSEHAGLGLLMVKELTRLLHIKLKVSVTAGSGTCFHLLFPVDTPA
jgi:signal transduction histidine kinase